MNSAALEKRVVRRVEEAKAFGQEAEAMHAAATRIDVLTRFHEYRTATQEACHKHRAAMRRFDRAEAIASVLRCGFARLQGHGVIHAGA